MMFLISRTAGHGLMDLFKRTLCFSAESTCVFYSGKATLPLVPITTISILFRGGGNLESSWWVNPSAWQYLYSNTFKKKLNMLDGLLHSSNVSNF